MKKLIFTYSLVKSIYEQGKDYLDVFWPFILKVLPRNKSALSLVQIQEDIKNKYGLEIPQHSLTAIITRAKRKKYIEQEKRQYRLTDEGDIFLNGLEPESQVERRINEMVEDTKNYLNEKLNQSLSSASTYDIILYFIYQHIDSLLECFNPASSLVQLDITPISNARYDIALIKYFDVVKNRKPQIYGTLVDIIYGSVISTTASTKYIAEINKKFVHTQIFLDSNFVFSILDLHYPEFSIPAKELFSLLKSYNFELKIFDFTIDEIVSVLKNYFKEQYFYIPGVRVNSIYSCLKTKGLTSEDIKEYIMKIESKIWNLGIKIELTDIDLNDYNPPHAEWHSKLSNYKHNTGLRSQNHDLAAIEKIMQIRGAERREIENSKALFLTSDLRLSKFDFLELDHKEKATVCEVVPDKLFTNILWLKNPEITKDIPLKSIIAIHSRGMFIDRKVWYRFIEITRKLKDDESIDDKDISMLFYNHYIEQVLVTFNDTHVDEITPDFILGEISKVSKLVDEETQRKLQEQESIFEKRLEQTEIIEAEKFEKALRKIKERLKIQSLKKAKTIAIRNILIAPVAFIITLLGLGFVINLGTAYIGFSFITGIVALLSFLDIKINLFKIRQRLEDNAFQKIYKKSLADLAINEVIDSGH